MNQKQEAERRAQLNAQPLKALIAIRDSYNLTMDPTQNYSLVDAIIEHERGMADTDRAVPGALLEESDERPGLDDDFTPNQAMRVEMYDYLAARFGEATVNALEFPWGGVQNKVAEIPPDWKDALRKMDEMAVSGPNMKYVDVEFAEEHRMDKILVNVDPRLIKTQSADYIINHILPRVLEHFLRKNAGYGDRHRNTRTGLKGELTGLDRKIDKVFDGIWNDKVFEFEQPEEMLWDIIGSCFLMLDLMEQDGINR
jgi:hypothetical protein